LINTWIGEKFNEIGRLTAPAIMCLAGDGAALDLMARPQQLGLFPDARDDRGLFSVSPQ
jgi:hypothetical protein